MSVNVTLNVWDDVGDDKFKILEGKTFTVDEKELYMLPMIAFDLGLDITERMTLSAVGLDRSNAKPVEMRKKK